MKNKIDVRLLLIVCLSLLITVLVLIIVWFVFDVNNPAFGSTLLISKPLISTGQVTITDFNIIDQTNVADDGDYEVDGKITNNSNYELTGITLTVEKLDCPKNIITSDCRTVGQDTNVKIETYIPAGQTREISDAYASLYDVSPVKDVMLWSYKVTGTSSR